MIQRYVYKLPFISLQEPEQLTGAKVDQRYAWIDQRK